MQLQMFTNILLNISLLTLIATLITGFGPVKKLFSEEPKGAFSKNQFVKNILLAIFFWLHKYLVHLYWYLCKWCNFKH